MQKRLISLSLGLLLVSFFFVWKMPVQAQTSPTPTPPVVTSTPDMLATLQAKVATQEAQITDLTHKVENAGQDQKSDAKEFRSRFEIIYAWVALFAGILALLGWRTLKDIRDEFKQKMTQERDELIVEMRKTFEKELYQLDLSNLNIYILWDKEMHPVRRRLELSGFTKISQVNQISNELEQGIVIVPAFSDKQVSDFIDKIKEIKLDPKRLAFILYTSSHRINEETQKNVSDLFENWTMANLPATVVSSLLVVGRGLYHEPNFN